MYISPIFRPLETHLFHFSFGKWEGSLSVREQLICVRKIGSNIIFWQVFILKSNFQVNNSSMFITQLFHSLHNFPFRLKAHFFKTEKLFLHQTFHEIDKPTLDFIFIFHPKIMKVILFCIETCLFMIQHEKLSFRIHVSNLIFLIKISVLHMKFTIWFAWQAYWFRH